MVHSHLALKILYLKFEGNMNAAKDESDFRNLVLQVLLIANARQSKSYNQNVEIYTKFYAKYDFRNSVFRLYSLQM